MRKREIAGAVLLLACALLGSAAQAAPCRSGGPFDTVLCVNVLEYLENPASVIQSASAVLKPGGSYLFNVWDAIDANPAPKIAYEASVEYFPDNPLPFMRVPFTLHDPEPIKAWLAEAGFRNIEQFTLSKEGTSPSAIRKVMARLWSARMRSARSVG